MGEALALAEPGAFIRLFIDEKPQVAQLLADAAERGIIPDYTHKLLAACGVADRKIEATARLPDSQPLIEPLTEREMEILRLVARGLSNNETGERLYLALSTVRGHKRSIFGKLQVQRRTEAVARARAGPARPTFPRQAET